LGAGFISPNLTPATELIEFFRSLFSPRVLFSIPQNWLSIDSPDTPLVPWKASLSPGNQQPIHKQQTVLKISIECNKAHIDRILAANSHPVFQQKSSVKHSFRMTYKNNNSGKRKIFTPCGICIGQLKSDISIRK
jgi:hypothetical protein